ncbi:unnamed protein product [Durusdinium trenchii]|uniref:PPPDE domain-containing protein n=1 Tax=Durusdinium trenchii TaxID=1381693 RepID=A0ABP0JU44_9DINO
MIRHERTMGYVSDRCFEHVEDYIHWMSQPSRVVYVEWRKVRHEKSRGLTSHSWLEVRLLDDRRLRMEIYADRGYTEQCFDPRAVSAPGAGTAGLRFFDPDSTIYDGRCAGETELRRALTAETLREEAKSLARRPYSLSEFNCHHFVLELWNSMVVDSLQSKHFPDRTKLGLLWGVEEMMGHWLQGASSLASVGAPTSGAAQRAPPTIPVRADVFLLETTGQMRLAEMPQSIETAGNSPTACWAARQLPGVEEAAMRVVELIRTFDILELNKRLELDLPKTTFSVFASFASTSSSSVGTSWEHCFVLLRGRELRLAVHSVGLGRQFLLLSGDALRNQEEHWQWRREEHRLSPTERAFQLQEPFRQALRRSAWHALPTAESDFKDLS